ncbi:uncharacterized protein LOC130994763 isoform X2 [Salvia miltiorrhiza]|uniref:uncharacterized protein LOC130994763 isoform X2 n=1 Tax=Salvia miltiorrhiza TaxID=226208 RepID=UPI0025AC9A2F|nr:uncharacterized protein LOC130994763 isoform X2 [Salvia miltiorrhiza]
MDPHNPNWYDVNWVPDLSGGDDYHPDLTGINLEEMPAAHSTSKPKKGGQMKAMALKEKAPVPMLQEERATRHTYTLEERTLLSVFGQRRPTMPSGVSIKRKRPIGVVFYSRWRGDAATSDVDAADVTLGMQVTRCRFRTAADAGGAATRRSSRREEEVRIAWGRRGR